ncbi:hypothetical protein [Streptomyces fructofermentans]|uniref:hypothetical protein n=1 Tax=Streptomyces fructofermentans TaxID=152141 RepID=UPI0037A234B8
METTEPTETEMVALMGALYGAIQPLARAMRGRMTDGAGDDFDSGDGPDSGDGGPGSGGGPGDDSGWDDGTPAVPLATLAAWRVASEEIERLAARSARLAGARGAGYPDLGAAWKISRQAARKRWPGVVTAERVLPASSHFRAFGGEALVTWRQEEGSWWWIATAANGRGDEAPDEASYASSEEAAAAAGAFLAANATAPRELAG